MGHVTSPFRELVIPKKENRFGPPSTSRVDFVLGPPLWLGSLASAPAPKQNRNQSFRTEFTERILRYRLLSDHLVEKGPSFKQAIDATIDAVTGQVTVRSVNKDGKEELHTERMDLPADLANGLLLSVLKDVPVDVPKTTLSLLATGPKPRVVTLEITPQRDDAFSVGTIHRKATHFVVKIKIGGIAGLVAPLIGKQPPDMHIWVVHGPAPAVIRMEAPLYEDGPVWRMQMSHPPVFKSSR